MHLPQLKDPLTDAEMEMLVKEMRLKNHQHGRDDYLGHGEVSEIAVNCIRCALVVLTQEETWAYEVATDKLTPPPCPLCDGTSTSFSRGAALAWNHQAKRFLWKHLYP